MIINHNMASLNTYNKLATNTANTAKSLEKLSSGLRINKAGDDAAGLAISEKMRGQIRGLDQAARNSQDAISLIQTAEGSLSETHSILQRMRELATQSANDTNTGSDRTEIQKEMNQLSSEINRIGNTTDFNSKKLLNGDIKIGKGATLDMTAANAPNYTGNSLSNVQLSSNSDAATGSYVATVENLGGKASRDVGTVQTPGGTAIAAGAVNNVSGTGTALAAGNYSVEVKTEQAKMIKDTTFIAATGIANQDAVTVAADSTLTTAAAGTVYKIAVTKNEDQTATDISSSGLSNLNLGAAGTGADAPVDGKYIIETSAELSGVANNGGTVYGSGAGAAINNVEIDGDSTFVENGTAQIQITKENSLTMGDLNGVTESTLATTSVADGKYDVTTTVGLTAVANKAGDTVYDATGTTGAITDVTVTNNSAFVENGTAQIKIVRENPLSMTAMSGVDTTNPAKLTTSAVADGKYNVTTTVGLTGVLDKAGDTLITSQAIKNISVTSNSTFAETGTGAQITLTGQNTVSTNNTDFGTMKIANLQLDGAATPPAGDYTITVADDGTGGSVNGIRIASVSDPTKFVLVDNATLTNGTNTLMLAGGNTFTLDIADKSVLLAGTTTAHVSADYTLSLVNNGVTQNSVKFSVSDSAGVNKVTLGDFTMDVDYTKLSAIDAASDLKSGDAIDFAMGKQMTITMQGDATKTATVDVTAKTTGTPTDFVLGNAGGTISLDVAGASVTAGQSSVVTVSNDNPAYTISLVNDVGGSDGNASTLADQVVAKTTFSVSSSGGVSSVKVGDVSMKVDFAALYADSTGAHAFDGDAINFDMGRQMTITSQTDPTKTVTKDVSAAAGATSFTLANSGGKIDLDVTGAAVTAGQSTVINVSNDNPTFKISLVNNVGVTDEEVASTTFTASLSGGLNSVRVGNIKMDVDFAKLYSSTLADPATSTYDGDAIDFAVQDKVTITNMDDATNTGSVNVTGGKTAEDITLAGGGTFNLDAAAFGSGFTRGTTLYTTVNTDTTYEVQLKDNANAAISGSSKVSLTSNELANSNYTNNVSLGNGVTVDLDADAIAKAVAGTSSTAFTLETAQAKTAVLQNATGATIGTKHTLNATGTEDLGSGISFNYDATAANGDYTFNIQENTTADDFRLTLTKDGTTDSTWDQKEIDPNATLNLGNGITLDTAVDMADGETATFEIIEGTKNQALSMQIGANQGQSFLVDVNDMRAESLGITGNAAGAVAVKDESGAVIEGATYAANKDVTNGTNNNTTEYALDVSDSIKASGAIKVIDIAIQSVSAERSKLGAFQNRLEHTIANLGTSSENLTSAESRIRDVDMAKEMMQFQKNNILAQAATAMLAQANQQPQGVLQLLR